MNSKQSEVCVYVVVDAMTVRAFLLEQIVIMSRYMAVYVLCNDADGLLQRDISKGGFDVTVVQTDLGRGASFGKSSLVSLYSMLCFFRKRKPTLLVTMTPKAGFLGQLTSFLSRSVETRVHIYTGQVWANLGSGGRKTALKSIDWITGWLATSILADSPSQIDFLVSNKITTRIKARSLGSGSISGVRKDSIDSSSVSSKSISAEKPLRCLMLGRVCRDKGIFDVIDAFTQYLAKENLELTIVGPLELDDQDKLRFDAFIDSGNVCYEAFTDDVKSFYRRADLLLMPSYREGFGSTVIEAAANYVPCVGSRIYGLTDAIVEGETGFHHEAGDVEGIVSGIMRFVESPGLLCSMGENARKRAFDEFDSAHVASLYASYLLDKRGVAHVL